MDKNFLKYYQNNLEYLRKLGGEFAKDFPKIASRLELTANECQDPYVERLLEGTAFLAARVEAKLDNGVPRLIEAVVNAFNPSLGASTPSSAIIELEGIDYNSISTSNVIPAGTTFKASIPTIDTQCVFSVLSDYNIFPVNVTDAKYLTLELSSYGIKSPAAISLDFHVFKTYMGKTGDLRLYINLPFSDTSELQNQLIEDLEAVYILKDGNAVKADDIDFRFPFNSENTKYSDENFFASLGTEMSELGRFFNFQSSFKYIDLHGFSKLLSSSGNLNLIFALKRRNSNLTHLINQETFKLNCIPVVNAFKKRSDRVEVDINHEFQVVSSRTAPFDYEVLQVNGIELYDINNKQITMIKEAYTYKETYGARGFSDTYTIHRRPWLLIPGKRYRSSYIGYETFVSFSGKIIRKYQHEGAQFSAELVCSNRDLPLLLTGNTVLTSSLENVVKQAKFIAMPTRPKGPAIFDGGLESWERISYLTLDISSMLWQPGVMPLTFLKEMIKRIYRASTGQDAEITDGITGLENQPETFRFVRNGSVFFENGWALKLTLDESHFAGIGYYIFGALVYKLIKSQCPINMPIRMELETKQQGKIAEWTKLN